MIQYAILDIVCEYGISNDGKPLVNEYGILRFNAIDWEKTNPIVKAKLSDLLFKVPDYVLDEPVQP